MAELVPVSVTSLSSHRATGPLPASWPSNMLRLWSPRDDVHGALVELLASVQHSIVLNMYGYDDDELDGLIRKHAADQNVYVQMSLDSSQAGGVHEREILKLWNADAFGTSIAIGQSARHAISHLKVLIIDGLWTVSGSTNLSTSGESKQDNELLITCDAVVAADCRTVLDINHAEMLRQMAAKKKVA